MKLKGFVAGVATMSFLGIGFISNSQQVNAATWHRGIPTTLRGHYSFNLHRKTVPTWGTLDIYLDVS